VIHTIELRDVTPNRATVSRILEGAVTATSLYYATVESDVSELPVIGERVWVKRNTLASRGPVTIVVAS
jgi:hypothetical protein